MKELSIEQKAKRYDEALERAKEVNDEHRAQPFDVMLKIFPELKESEDEKIRESLLEYLHTLPNHYAHSGVCAPEWIAWLEKQCNQKPADKVEPKFHKSEWITNNIETVQITGYDIDYGYQVDYKGNLQHRDTNIIEKEYHLWTIQDAKSGDVIYLPNGNDEYYFFIFKGIENATVMSFAHFYQYNDGTSEVEGTIDNLSSVNDVFQPATKEQRDLLFQKMKEDGYEWDADKLELKKIVSIDESLVDENVTTFCNITKEMCELYARKNHDYGNSFDEGCDKIGTSYPLGRLLDKMNRLIACMGKENKMQVNESIEDTLTDLACYSVMTLSYLKRKNNK